MWGYSIFYPLSYLFYNNSLPALSDADTRHQRPRCLPRAPRSGPGQSIARVDRRRLQAICKVDGHIDSLSYAAGKASD